MHDSRVGTYISHTHIYIYIYIYIYVIYIHTYIYIYIHIYICTYVGGCALRMMKMTTLKVSCRK